MGLRRPIRDAWLTTSAGRLVAKVLGSQLRLSLSFVGASIAWAQGSGALDLLAARGHA